MILEKTVVMRNHNQPDFTGVVVGVARGSEGQYNHRWLVWNGFCARWFNDFDFLWEVK